MNSKKMKVKVVKEINEVVVKFSISNFELCPNSVSVIYKDNEEEVSLKEGYNFSTGIKEFLYILSYYSITGRDMIIDKNSLDCFYMIEGNGREYFPALDNYFFEEWYNYDFPILFKYSINKKGKTDFSGRMKFVSSCILVEDSYGSIYVDEDIEDNEIKDIVSFLEKRSPLCEKLNSMLEARHSTLDDLNNAYSFVKSYEEKVQKVIDNHKEEFEERFKNDIHRDYGLDCGFLLVYTQNEEYNRKKRLLINSPIRVNDEILLSTEEVQITLPLFTQSTTLKRQMFEFLKPILEKEIKDSFYCRIILD